MYCRFCNLEVQNVEHRFKHFEKGNLCLLNNNNLANIVDSQPAAEYDDENNLFKPKQPQERIGFESKVTTKTKGFPFIDWGTKYGEHINVPIHWSLGNLKKTYIGNHRRPISSKLWCLNSDVWIEHTCYWFKHRSNQLITLMFECTLWKE